MSIDAHVGGAWLLRHGTMKNTKILVWNAKSNPNPMLNTRKGPGKRLVVMKGDFQSISEQKKARVGNVLSLWATTCGQSLPWAEPLHLPSDQKMLQRG